MPFLSVADPAAWNLTIQIRTTPDDPGASPTWSDWQDLIIGDYTCRAMQFRAIFTSEDGTTTPLVTALGIEVDVAGRNEHAVDVVSGTSGYLVTYAHPFYASPTVTIAAQDMATGDYYKITAKSETGYTITFYDSSATIISRTFDWASIGYGQQT